MGTIILATDGSDAAQVAEAAAFELAAARGDALVDFGLPYDRLLAPDSVDIEHEWAHETLAAVGERAAAAGLEIETVCRHGKPAREICELARERGARAIVVGTRGWGTIEGALFGSVAQRVLGHAPCEVLVVPSRAHVATPALS